MNKNTIIGITLIGLLLIGFSVYNSRIAREQQEIQRVRDSVAAANAFEYAERMAQQMAADSASAAAGQGTQDGQPAYVSTYANPFLEQAYNAGEDFHYLENNKLRIKYSTKGGQAASVLIKDYYTSDSTDLYLMKDDYSDFGLQLYTDQYINTGGFTYETVVSNDSTLVMRLYFSDTAFIEHRYFLPADSYMVDFDVHMVNMDRHIPRNASQFEIAWNMDVPRLERGYKNEQNYSTVDFKYPGQVKKIENLGIMRGGGRSGGNHREVTTRIEWFAFQQQYFSAILRAEENFESGNLSMKFYPETDAERRLMACSASTLVQYEPGDDVTVPFEFYYGPNHFRTLKSYDCDFEKIVPLGGWLVRWINRGIIIPVFDLFGRFISNYGIIILLLTLLIKLVISPLTFKSYMSSAKMNVLRPELDKINAKYPRQEDALKKQQETMDLYRKAGVSMFGGCLPMLLQFPVLFAMFRFFPASFELRQKGFLWADDLSTYDSILDFGFNIPLYGDHVSLFAILCALSMYFSARMTQGSSADNNPQMKSMRNMTLYFMPIFMLFICNNLSSGLTYYYLLSNLIMMLQTWIIRRFFVDEEKIMARVRAASVKGAAKPKSKFQQRLEAIQKAQQEAIREQQKQQQRRR